MPTGQQGKDNFLYTKTLPQLTPNPLFKLFVPPPLFSAPPSFKVFWTVPFTQTQPLPALVRPTNFPCLKQISKGHFTSSTVAFHQKSVFNLLNPLTNRLS